MNSQNLNKSLLLAGTRVVDYSRILVGAYASMLLADQGAEVIKVESPDGDDTRKWGPPFINNDSTYYLSVNRNKKSLCIDIKNKSSIELMHDLISKSDIFIENNVPDKIKLSNLDYEKVKSINKRLIYVSVSSFSNQGPLKYAPGFDLSIQAFTGLMNITGFTDGPPTKAGYPLCDIMTGSHVNSAILSALLHRERTGEGQYINTSLMEVNLFTMTNVVSAWLNGNTNSKRRGNDHPNIAPYGVFQMKSQEFIALAVGTDNQFKKLIGLLELDRDQNFNFEDFSTNKLRVKNRDSLKKLIQDKMLELEDEVLISKIQKAEIPFSKINSMKDIFEHEHVRQIGVLDEVETENYGKLKFVKNPIHNSKLRNQDFESPPLLGEHTMYVLKDLLGYKEDKIKQLFENNAVFKSNLNKV